MEYAKSSNLGAVAVYLVLLLGAQTGQIGEFLRFLFPADAVRAEVTTSLRDTIYTQDGDARARLAICIMCREDCIYEICTMTAGR